MCPDVQVCRYRSSPSSHCGATKEARRQGRTKESEPNGGQRSQQMSDTALSMSVVGQAVGDISKVLMTNKKSGGPLNGTPLEFEDGNVTGPTLYPSPGHRFFFALVTVRLLAPPRPA